MIYPQKPKKDEKDDISTEAEKDEENDISAAKVKENKRNGDDEDDGYKYIECNWDDFIDRTPYDEESLYPGEPRVFGDSDDEEDYETSVIKISDRNFATVKIPRSTSPASRRTQPRAAPKKPSASGTIKEATFCQYCFLSGQPVSVTHSHNILDVSCPSMTDEDKERIHGPNWLPKMYGYYD